jgi:hypothetical protein
MNIYRLSLFFTIVSFCWTIPLKKYIPPKSVAAAPVLPPLNNTWQGGGSPKSSSSIGWTYALWFSTLLHKSLCPSALISWVLCYTLDIKHHPLPFPRYKILTWGGDHDQLKGLILMWQLSSRTAVFPSANGGHGYSGNERMLMLQLLAI